MNSRSLAPILHSIRTFPSMILETACIPSHLIRQESDWKALCDRFERLDQYYTQEKEIQNLLKPAYADYLSNHSSSLISLSLNRASFLFYFARLIQAKHILDLGSGFSSYVFSRYTHDVGGTVVSVDDSEFWMNETKTFLSKYDLGAVEFMSLSMFNQTRTSLPTPDLCFLDIGDLTLRTQLLPSLIDTVIDTSMSLCVDDFHVPAYRKVIINFCKERNVNLFSLRKVTRRRLSHAALITA